MCTYYLFRDAQESKKINATKRATNGVLEVQENVEKSSSDFTVKVHFLVYFRIYVSVHKKISLRVYLLKHMQIRCTTGYIDCYRMHMSVYFFYMRRKTRRFLENCQIAKINC